MLNKGRQQVGAAGARNSVSFGNQSPSSDATALAWNAGDWRGYIGTSTTILGWRCTVAGTPGTWVQINTGGSGPEPVILQVPFLFQGAFDAFVGDIVYGAPASADWLIDGEGGDIWNLWAVPSINGAAPAFLRLTGSIIVNDPGTPTVNGITISVVNAAGAIVGAGAATGQLNANPATVGSFDFFGGVAIPDVAIGDRLALKVQVDPAVGTLGLFWSLTLSILP